MKPPKITRPFAAFCDMLIGAALTVTGMHLLRESNATIGDVKQRNHSTLRALGLVSQVQTENSDLVMRFSHFTHDHTHAVGLCPECTSGGMGDDNPVEISVDDVGLVLSLDHLVADANEIQMGVGNMLLGLKIQRDALRHYLLRLRRRTHQSVIRVSSVKSRRPPTEGSAAIRPAVSIVR